MAEEVSEDEIVAQIVRYARSGRFLTREELKAAISADYPDISLIETAMRKAATLLVRQSFP